MKIKLFGLLIILLLVGIDGGIVIAQTRRNPVVRWVTALPATCSPTSPSSAAVYLSGAGHYYCISPNTWAPVSGVGKGSLTGTGTMNFVSRFTSPATLGDTPLLWDNTKYLFNNTTLNSEFTASLVPSSTVGRFRVGDFTTTPTTYFDLDNDSFILATGAGPPNQSYLTQSQTGAEWLFSDGFTQTTFNIGNSGVMISTAGAVNILGASSSSFQLGAGGDAFISAPAGSQGITLTSPVLSTSAASVSFHSLTSLTVNRTTTATGTTGNVIINKSMGTVNFAAGTGTLGLTVTNSTVSTNSYVFAMARTNDVTCSVKNVVPALGSFVIRMDSNCTAETSVAFWVTN